MSTTVKPGVSAKAVAETIWHNMVNNLTRFRHVALSAPRADDRGLTITGPYLEVMELLMLGWSVEQGGRGMFFMDVFVSDHLPENYSGDDCMVTVMADFHTSR